MWCNRLIEKQHLSCINTRNHVTDTSCTWISQKRRGNPMQRWINYFRGLQKKKRIISWCRTTLTNTFMLYYKKWKKSIPISLFINSDRLSAILTNRWTSDILWMKLMTERQPMKITCRRTCCFLFKNIKKKWKPPLT